MEPLVFSLFTNSIIKIIVKHCFRFFYFLLFTNHYTNDTSYTRALLDYRYPSRHSVSSILCSILCSSILCSSILCCWRVPPFRLHARRVQRIKIFPPYGGRYPDSSDEDRFVVRRSSVPFLDGGRQSRFYSPRSTSGYRASSVPRDADWDEVGVWFL